MSDEDPVAFVRAFVSRGQAAQAAVDHTLSLFNETAAVVTPAKRKIAFTVTGTAQAQGSKRAFTPKGWTRPIIVDSNPNLKQWRQLVAMAAQDAMAETPIIDGAVRLILTFWFTRPASAAKKVVYKTTKPDVLKCARAVEDALSRVVYRDDSQVVDLTARKLYGQPPGVAVIVEEL